eukprot:gene3567-biopygen4657
MCAGGGGGTRARRSAGANTCPHTRKAVTKLGGKWDAKEQEMVPPPGIDYVDCADVSSDRNMKRCQAQGIKGYPTFMRCEGQKCTEVPMADFGLTVQDL